MITDGPIKKFIKDSGKTQNEIATLMNTTQSNLANKMQRDSFSTVELVKLADALGMKLCFVPADYVNPSCYVVDYSAEEKGRLRRIDKAK